MSRMRLYIPWHVAAVVAVLLATGIARPAADGPGVNGRVLALDEKGLPRGTVAAANIEFKDRAGKVAARVTADKKGCYKVNLAPGMYTYKIQAAGFKDENAGRRISLTLTEGYAVCNFSLIRGKNDPSLKTPTVAAVPVGTLTGRVMEKTGGGKLVGIPRATIFLRKTAGRELAKVVAKGGDPNRDGFYEVVLEAGSYQVSVIAAGFETSATPASLAILDGKTATQDFVLTRPKQFAHTGQGIKGLITLAQSKESLPKVKLSLRPLAGTGGTIGLSSPDVNGNYQRDLGPGRYQVMAEAEGFRKATSAPRDVFAGKYTVVNLRLLPLPKALTFLVTVSERLPGGGRKPLPGVSILLRKQGQSLTSALKGTTGSDGEVSLKVGAAGSYQVLARMKGFKAAGLQTEIRSAANNHMDLELVREVSLVALNLRVVQGTDKLTRPVAKAKILVRQEGRTVKSASSNQDGRVSFSLPPGAYRIEATGVGYDLARMDVSLAANEVRRDIVLTKRRSSTKLALNLRVMERLKAGDKMVAAAQVVISQKDKHVLENKSGADGRLTVALAPGTYTVVVTRLGFKSATVQVSLSGKDVNQDIVLTRSPLKKDGSSR
jgi:hypothetical protein